MASLTTPLQSGLADEIQLAVAPFFIGDSAAPRFVNPAVFPDGPGRPYGAWLLAVSAA